MTHVYRYRDGEPDAVDTVDQWIRSATYSYRIRLGNDLDDLVQSIHMELVRLLRSEQLKIETSFKAYVWRVANHRAIDQLRRLSRQHLMQELEDSIASQARSPFQAMVDLQTAELAFAVMKRAKQACQDIWHRIVNGESYEQMGKALGMNAGALRIKALRCRQQAAKIRDQLINEKRNKNATLSPLSTRSRT